MNHRQAQESVLFNFTLSPLESILPWGGPEDPHLHWFGLTDGEYWIEAGETILFEYSSQARERQSFPRFCDYQVARLHEDVLDIIPCVLDAVPARLARYIQIDPGSESGNVRGTLRRVWHDQVRSGQYDDPYLEIIDGAYSWISRRRLDNGYLTPSAEIQMWSDDSVVRIEWDNRDKMIDGAQAWSAVSGSYQLPREEFVMEVRSFHNLLMQQMSERVLQVVSGALPNVRIDLTGLLKEHAQRSADIDGIFSGPAATTDWRRVQEAITRILSDNSNMTNLH
jgi:hypothetical protein